ncbi:uncharacterized protein MICPUCDRAFT_60777 [Micromonas pusilla CCMP1545]|jgi:rhodanese-related sulfurtransferase|uniref:Predicted protein n=1 Tax=Micromonas pusilla (strain CCMP1545) TaxID=564608 RepID=C1MZL9_MICPC|nr:uncharacterized protein MICPUCDRAFT_60777 [Micromonas pusilla CCMP1545]EEH54626.1 predicted protein [Micromonas pusilla CCMP1545]|eukprot:XP_003060976.1 predicted protein [Micromonas pusilla CCMP1545]
MHITNIGGSLTTAVCLSLIAWSIRVLRAQQKADQNRSNRGGARAGGPGGAYLPSLRHRRAYARLSPTAFWLLTDSKSVKCFIVDVRSAEEVRAAESSGSGDDVVSRLEHFRVPVDDLASALKPRGKYGGGNGVDGGWAARFGAAPPSPRSTIVFVSTHGHSASQAASLAVSLGFQRCCVIEGGLAAAAPLAPPPPRSPSCASLSGDDVANGSLGSLVANGSSIGGGQSVSSLTSPGGKSHSSQQSSLTSPTGSSSSSRVSPSELLSRDALGLLLEYGAAQGEPLMTLIDVRRHDERSLYGGIRSSSHLAVEQLPKALLMSNEEWARTFHFRKPGEDDVVVLYSRRMERAVYAKQLLNDAGMHRCLVLADGVVGWCEGGAGAAEGIAAYRGYREGETPPEPERGDAGDGGGGIDRGEAEAELVRKRVLLP